MDPSARGSSKREARPLLRAFHLTRTVLGFLKKNNSGRIRQVLAQHGQGESIAADAWWDRQASWRLAQGLLQTVGGGRDLPFR